LFLLGNNRKAGKIMEIELTRLFIKVIQYGGFSKAAEALKIPKSTISKAVSRLEKETGTRLLIRTTRNQSLTAAGRVFYETCLGPIQILEEAQKSLFGKDNIISGKIKLTAPEDIGTQIIAPVIGKLCLKYPKLEFELKYTNEMVDLVKEGFDFAIRVGPLDQSGLKQRKIGEIEMQPVASPLYLKSRAKILTPKDLEQHQCLTLPSSAMSKEWLLKKERQSVRVQVKSQVQCNQISSLLKIAVAGAGIALVPQFLCRDEISEGKLVRVLPEWSGVKPVVSILSPLSMISSLRLNVVSAEIISALREALESE
jgi:DNA-binding transcriptional LysR family regulator